jgi:TIR domain
MSQIVPPFSVFISYAHKDDNDKDVSKRYLHRLRRQLTSLVRQSRVAVCSDKDIEIGDRWHERLLEDMRNAKAAVLLVGPEFFHSDFIRNVEVPLLLEKADVDGLIILPVILSGCLFEENSFKYPHAENGPNEKSLSLFQTANPPERPLNSMVEHEQEEVFVSVARRVYRIVEPLPPVPTTIPTVEAGEQVRAVEGALDLLHDLVKTSSRVRDAVQRFRFTFEAASANIERLSAYKALHDLLHTLQFQCLDLITVELSLFPEDPGSEDRLMGPEQDLQGSIAAIRAGVQRWENFDFRSSRLIDNLQTAHTELQDALENQDGQRLKSARLSLDRVLSTYPAKINTLLLEAARGLRLPTLVGTMNDVKSRLVDLRVEQQQVQQFVEGLESLTALDVRLKGLLYEHDEWQTADGEMRISEISGEGFVESLALSWPRLKVITEILYRENSAELAQQLEKDSQRLDAALGSQNPSLVKSAYRRFRRRAALRFYEVDTELLKLCSSLQEVGAPLERVLRRLDPDDSGGN